MDEAPAAVSADARSKRSLRMLGARSVAVVGASARPDSFGARMVIEAQRSSARMHLVNPRYDRIGDLTCAAVARRPRRARRPGPARGAGQRAGRPAGRCRRCGRPRRRSCSAPPTGCATRWPPSRREAGHGTVRCGLHGLRQQRASVCARSATWSRMRCPRGGVSLSPTPGRRSRRCCGRGVGSGSGSPCRRDRNSSPTPPITSTTRSTTPAPRSCAAAGDTARGAAAAPRPARAHDGGIPAVVLPGRRFTDRTGHGRRPLRCAGRR